MFDDEDYLSVLREWIYRIGLSEFDEWSQNNGVTGGIEDDQDGDGESEYFGFLGLNNPNDQTSNGLVLALTGTFTDTATNEEGHQFSWEIRENTVIGVDYDVQLSTDLDGFVTGIPGTDFTIEASDSLGNGLDRINIRVLTDAERQFLRLISP